jgi:transposase
VGGRLIQADYIVILKKIVAPEWKKDYVLIEDNDGPHGTKGKGPNKVKAAKARLDIQWEANPANSPDLNPIETIWRIIKQRLKSRGVIFDVAVLRRAIQEEWDNLTIKEINKAILTMPARVKALRANEGRPIPF